MRDFIVFRSYEEQEQNVNKKLVENSLRRKKQTLEKGARLYVLNKQKENYIFFKYFVDLLTSEKNIKLSPEEFLSEYNRILDKICESVLLQGFEFLEDEELKKDMEYTKVQVQKIKFLIDSNIKEKNKKKAIFEKKNELLNKSKTILNSLKIFLESYWIQVYKKLYPSMTHGEAISTVVKNWELLNNQDE